MSVESLSVVLHHSRARGTAKLVLVGIANHDGDGGSFPKIATLARYANVHPRRVVEAIKQLGELGEIAVHTKEGGTRRTPEHVRPNLYEILLSCPDDCDRTSAHRLEGQQIGRRYAGQRDPDYRPDPDLSAKRKAAHDARKAGIAGAQLPGQAVDNLSDDLVTETSPGDGNVTTPGDGNVTTKNHPLEPSIEIAWVPTSPAAAPSVENPQSQKDPMGLTPEQQSRNSRGAALARAALRGQQGTAKAAGTVE